MSAVYGRMGHPPFVGMMQNVARVNDFKM